VNILPILLAEDFRDRPYDDAIGGKPIVKGDKIEGTVTFGHGLTNITEAESKAIVQGRCERLEAILGERIPGFDGLSANRKAALIELAYNMGVDGLLKFHRMLGALWEHDYPQAADELLESVWAKQVGPTRSERIATMIREG